MSSRLQQAEMVPGSMEIVHEGMLKKSPPQKRLWRAVGSVGLLDRPVTSMMSAIRCYLLAYLKCQRSKGVYLRSR